MILKKNLLSDIDFFMRSIYGFCSTVYYTGIISDDVVSMITAIGYRLDSTTNSDIILSIFNDEIINFRYINNAKYYLAVVPKDSRYKLESYIDALAEYNFKLVYEVLPIDNIALLAFERLGYE